MVRVTPMVQQYLAIKRQYPDAVLFYRMGDFYEMFFEDAEKAAPILNIALTSRNRDDEDPIPMCGVPHHSVSSYISKLIERGIKVAVCDQMEDPKTAKGVVRREVTRVITPGMQVDTETLQEGIPNYVAAVAEAGSGFAVSCLDISTGDFRVTRMGALSQAVDELGRIQPAELLIPESLDFGEELERFSACTEGTVKSTYAPETLSVAEASTLLKDQLGVASLEGFGLMDSPEQIWAAARVLHYALETQKTRIPHLSDLVVYPLSDAMILDESAQRNLELLESLHRKSTQGSLLGVLNQTCTAMGSRLLREWICYPRTRMNEIQERLDAVDAVFGNMSLREMLRDELKNVADLERLNSKVALARANARDLVALESSFRRIPRIRELLCGSGATLLVRLLEDLDPMEDVSGWIRETLNENPPVGISDGGIIRPGVHPDLDRYIEATRDNKAWIARLETDERDRTGISNLKIGYNKVFGYYIEVSKSRLDRVPYTYIRKQTLVHAERFVTQELKDREELILEAQDRRVQLEYELFAALRERIAGHSRRIRATAGSIAVLDVVSALAHVAHYNGYVKPRLNDRGEIHIENGRHPVVEQAMEPGTFVPNDIHLDMKGEQILIITGPNMAGKSTVLRQTALITLMGHMGSFVPASDADLGLVDRIFTRIGASDDLYRGLSTFMVEMIETARIVHQSTPKSLLVLDEIGRGTSTLDGLSIAWALVEHLHNKRGQGVKTLFATHYHELTDLARELPRVRNYNIAVKEWQGRVLFLRKMVRGGTSHSYGLEVARLAGLPKSIIERGKRLLRTFESGNKGGAAIPAGGRRKSSTDTPSVQMSLFGERGALLAEKIQSVDPNSLTPLDALQLVFELKRLSEESGRDRNPEVKSTSV